jgi:hypothetical protein
MAIESTKIAEFRVSKDRLIGALSNVSFAGKAFVALIVNMLNRLWRTCSA